MVSHAGVIEGAAISDEKLTAWLAQRVMGWNLGPGRFLLSDRRWKPRWRFQPCRRLEDAFSLLDTLKTAEYAMGRKGAGAFWVRVRLRKGVVGEARAKSIARAICLAVARALGIDVDLRGPRSRSEIDG